MADRFEDRYRSRRYSGEGEYGRDRGLMDRAGDEVRSWFGDEDASRRRERDDRETMRDREYGYREDRPYRDASREGTWSARHGYEREAAWSPERWSTTRVADRGWSGTAADAGRGPGYAHREYETRHNRASYSDEPFSRYPTNERHTVGGYATAYDALDRETTGSFVGRGPKGYRRSDERIHEDVCDRLCEDPWIDASDIDIAVNGGEVTLAGFVRERDDKRRAEDLVERVSGVREVHNTLRVSRTDPARHAGDVLGLSSAGDSPDMTSGRNEETGVGRAAPSTGRR